MGKYICMDTLVLKFSENRLLDHNNSKVELLSVNVITADKKISEKLNVKLGTKVLKITASKIFKGSL